MKKIAVVAAAAIPVLVILWLPLYFFFGIDPLYLKGFIAGQVTSKPKSVSFEKLSLVDSHGTLTGFQAETYFSLPKVNAIAFQGSTLFATTGDGKIVSLIAQEGAQPTSRVYATGLKNPTGLLPLGNQVFVLQEGKLSVYIDNENKGISDFHRDIMTGLPDAPLSNSLVLGPDGLLYFAVGARSDRGEFPIAEMEASIVQATLDGSQIKVFATGIRNGLGLTFDQAGNLWSTDQGQQVPSFGVPDELNKIVSKGSYGWPNCWGNNAGSNCKPGSIQPLGLLMEHGGASSLLFYRGRALPDKFQNNFLVALSGSKSGDPTIGKKIVRVIIDAKGVKTSDFAFGLDKPTSLAQDPAGNLFVADNGSGRIIKISAIYQ